NEQMFEKSTPYCPICDGPMMIRESAKKTFYGCCDYPVCKGLRPFKSLRRLRRDKPPDMPLLVRNGPIMHTFFKIII
ncbi:MAG: topoisomerase DNA-binding C4 zinc finger domain-containing protein, partial [Candidatus Methanomethylophilaceae archaeon]|nr:topoisomerase DNA-binding C4 zinc finger domain-containing protein [Candidatus Methanomethylophilaceae archaeon]